MTRRTPQPGDTYTKGDVTWRVEAVTHLDVGAVTPAGVLVKASWAPRIPMTLAQFHQAIAIATWGRA